MKKRRLSVAQEIALSFALVIFTGSLLLTLPISQATTSNATYFDNLFTSVSMVCVTGLFIEPVYKSYTTFGQIICIILMQIGGLGLMTLIASLFMGIGKNMRFADKQAVKEALNKADMRELKPFLINIVKYTLIIEGIGFLLLTTVFVPQFGVTRGLFNSLFVTVSAFCNAGFDNFGAISLQSYVHNPIINFTVSSLIILGGIGFAVWFDVTKNTQSLIKSKHFSVKKLFKKLKPHTKFALTVTAIVITSGTLIGMILEYRNMNSIGGFSLFDKFMTSYFQTVTMRTAGFATVDYTLMRPISNYIFVFTMLIGGSPGGAAGGVKTTTFALVVLLVYSQYKSRENINVFNHTVSNGTMKNALVIMMTFLLVLFGSTGLLMIFEPHVQLLPLLFEAVSALCTVGVSMNLTPSLSQASHIVIMLLMFMGRIGPMTMLLSFGKPTHEREITYTDANVLIG